MWWCGSILLTPKPHQPFYPVKRKTDPELSEENDTDEPAVTPCLGFRRKKPQWVIDEVIYLKAVHPFNGGRTIANIFNRRHHAKHDMTVSKTWVYETIKKHRYEIQVLRRHIKHRRPKPVPNNTCWGIDLTTVTDDHRQQHLVFAIIDYGSRRCLCLQPLNNKRSITLVFYLFKTIHHFGKPKSIKTDNERVFTSRLFKTTLNLFRIKHQRSDIACPWQNGRVERLIGTFKEKISKLFITDQHHLAQLLPDFIFWYNAVRPHQHLGGKTPLETWHRVNVFQKPYQHRHHFEAWDELLTGEY
jgi:transposase InsO family protein